MNKRIVVYCGSHFGDDAAYAAFAGEAGEMIARRGDVLVYGGGSVGLMGVLADAALAAGGKVIGVIPEVFIAKEQAHRNVTTLHEVKDLWERKRKMIELGDAFLALPGGWGTLEEVADTLNYYHIYVEAGKRPPVIVANVDGLYDSLEAQVLAFDKAGFAEKRDWEHLYFADSLAGIEKILDLTLS